MRAQVRTTTLGHLVIILLSTRGDTDIYQCMSYL
jgi:hypothetical protein